MSLRSFADQPGLAQLMRGEAELRSGLVGLRQDDDFNPIAAPVGQTGEKDLAIPGNLFLTSDCFHLDLSS
jgi:hypothetical protein